MMQGIQSSDYSNAIERIKILEDTSEELKQQNIQICKELNQKDIRILSEIKYLKEIFQRESRKPIAKIKLDFEHITERLLEAPENIETLRSKIMKCFQDDNNSTQ